MDNNQPGYRYPSIEMRKSPDRKIWWVIGGLIILVIILLARMLSSK